MKNDAANAKSRSRSRKRAVAPVAPTSNPAIPEPANSKNVGSLESAFSLGLGVLFVVGALFPRSFKQLFLLAMGGGLVYRGMTSHCGAYQMLGLDSEKGSLLQQISDKYLAGSVGKRG